jgi:hypothetical protein
LWDQAPADRVLVVWPQSKMRLRIIDLPSVEMNGIEPSASSMPFRGELKKNV